VTNTSAGPGSGCRVPTGGIPPLQVPQPILKQPDDVIRFPIRESGGRSSRAIRAPSSKAASRRAALAGPRPEPGAARRWALGQPPERSLADLQDSAASSSTPAAAHPSLRGWREVRQSSTRRGRGTRGAPGRSDSVRRKGASAQLQIARSRPLHRCHYPAVRTRAMPWPAPLRTHPPSGTGRGRLRQRSFYRPLDGCRNVGADRTERRHRRSAACRARIAWVVRPLNGGSPASIS